MIVLLIVLSITLVFQTTNNAFGIAVTPSFITIDLSATPNVNDFPYGITCDDPNYVWATISSISIAEPLLSWEIQTPYDHTILYTYSCVTSIADYQPESSKSTICGHS